MRRRLGHGRRARQRTSGLQGCVQSGLKDCNLEAGPERYDAHDVFCPSPAPVLPASFMFEDLAPLRPLLPTADVLAARTEWGPLYDAKTLASNKVRPSLPRQ